MLNELDAKEIYVICNLCIFYLTCSYHSLWFVSIMSCYRHCYIWRNILRHLTNYATMVYEMQSNETSKLILIVGLLYLKKLMKIGFKRKIINILRCIRVFHSLSLIICQSLLYLLSHKFSNLEYWKLSA